MGGKEDGMNAKRFMSTVLCAGMALSALAATQKTVVPIAKQLPPPLRKCLDVIFASFTVRLVSTQVGMPGKEFHTDTVRLRAVLKNTGNLALPPGTFIELRLYRNNDNIGVRYYQDILGASGSTWAWDRTDTFTHGVPTTYMVYASLSSVAECSIDNNTARLTVSEALLHAGK
jgi:hypothetical protein